MEVSMWGLNGRQINCLKFLYFLMSVYERLIFNPYNRGLDVLMRWFPDTPWQRAMALAHCCVISGTPTYFWWITPEGPDQIGLVHLVFGWLGGTFSLVIVITIILRTFDESGPEGLHRERCKYWALSAATFLFWAVMFSWST